MTDPIPEKLYLQIEYEGEPTDDRTHCVDRVNDSDVEYVRVSEVEALADRFPEKDPPVKV